MCIVQLSREFLLSNSRPKFLVSIITVRRNVDLLSLSVSCMCVRVCLCVYYVDERVYMCIPVYPPLHLMAMLYLWLTPLSQGLTLKVELGWQPPVCLSQPWGSMVLRIQTYILMLAQQMLYPLLQRTTVHLPSIEDCLKVLYYLDPRGNVLDQNRTGLGLFLVLWL